LQNGRSIGVILEHGLEREARRLFLYADAWKRDDKGVLRRAAIAGRTDRLEVVSDGGTYRPRAQFHGDVNPDLFAGNVFSAEDEAKEFLWSWFKGRVLSMTLDPELAGAVTATG
jgi:hypothetical protein